MVSRAVALLPVFLMVVAAASGCIGQEPGKPAGTTQTSQTNTSTTNNTTAPPTNMTTPTPTTNTTVPPDNETGNGTGEEKILYDMGFEVDPKGQKNHNFCIYVNDDCQGTGLVNPLSKGWVVTDKEKLSGAKGFTMQDVEKNGYHDNEFTWWRSDSIPLKNATSAQLSFWMKGDSEANEVDGIHWDLSANGLATTWIPLGKHSTGTSNALPGWKEFKVDLTPHLIPGKNLHLRFSFFSDTSCSADTPLPAGCGAGAYTGYFLDDIKITGR